jgi:hypothetical protein
LTGPPTLFAGREMLPILSDHGKTQDRLPGQAANQSGQALDDARIADGSLQAVLTNKSVVTLFSEGGGTITWTSSNGLVVLKAPLRRGDSK